MKKIIRLAHQEKIFIEVMPRGAKECKYMSCTVLCRTVVQCSVLYCTVTYFGAFLPFILPSYFPLLSTISYPTSHPSPQPSFCPFPYSTYPTFRFIFFTSISIKSIFTSLLMNYFLFFPLTLLRSSNYSRIVEQDMRDVDGTGCL